MKSGGNRLYDKVKTQVFNNPRTLHTIAHGLDDVGRYGGAVGKIGAGVATGLGHPEIGAVFSAGSALAGAAGHAGHLVDESRGCTVDDIYNTVIITAIQAQQ